MASSADVRRDSTAPPLIAVHHALGGGKVADVLLWRRRELAAATLAGATVVWCLLELSGYGILSLFSNALLLVVVVLFFWAKSAVFLQRPLPPLPNLEVSDQVVEKFAGVLSEWIDAGLHVAHEITIEKDRMLFLKVVLVLWTISYFGSFFNFLTLVYIGFLVSISVPVLYEKYHDYVDDKLVILRKLASEYESSLNVKEGKSD